MAPLPHNARMKLLPCAKIYALGAALLFGASTPHSHHQPTHDFVWDDTEPNTHAQVHLPLVHSHS